MNGLELNGSVYGFTVGDINGQALDGIGRNYSVNLAQTNINTDGATMYNSIASFNTTTEDGVIAGADTATQQFTVGQNMWSNADEDTGNGKSHVHMLNSTGLDTGIWGEVDNTNIIDNVVTYTRWFYCKGKCNACKDTKKV